jgi:hypothetical protein
MKKDITLKEHLAGLRKKAHETQRKNGHFQAMTKARLAKAKKVL